MSEPQLAPLRTPREVLARYYRAMVDKSADDLADLYAVDAVHEFPFAVPGFPLATTGARPYVRGTGWPGAEAPPRWTRSGRSRPTSPPNPA